jgi:RimJ/RimL family protein N-acetyltransferase
MRSPAGSAADHRQAVALRPAGAADRERVIALARHPAVAASLATDTAERLADAFDPPADDGELLVIEHDGAFAGAVRWVLVNRRSRIADVRALMLEPPARGRGLATAALRQLAARLLTERGLHRLEAEVYGFNHTALRTFGRAGFTREGTRRRAYDRHGQWQDGIRFGLLAEELEARR